MNPLEEDENAWPDEPEEFDPDSLGPDPPDSTPRQQRSLVGDESTHPGLEQAFWASVLLLNVAIAAIAIGLMLVYFQSDYQTGLFTILVGFVAAIGTARYYWRVKTGQYTDERDLGESTTDEGRSTSGEGGTATGDDP